MWYVTYQASADPDGILTVVGARGQWCNVPALRKLGEATYARVRGYATLAAAEARLAGMRPAFASSAVGNPQVRQYRYVR